MKRLEKAIFAHRAQAEPKTRLSGTAALGFRFKTPNSRSPASPANSQLGVHADDVVGRVHVALLAALLRMGSRRVCGCTMLLRILVLYLNSRIIIQNSI